MLQPRRFIVISEGLHCSSVYAEVEQRHLTVFIGLRLSERTRYNTAFPFPAGGVLLDFEFMLTHCSGSLR